MYSVQYQYANDSLDSLVEQRQQRNIFVKETDAAIHCCCY